jgi:hypothetical protein
LSNEKSDRKSGTFKTGSFPEFKEFSLAVVRGERQIDPKEPKIWVERTDASRPAKLAAYSS